MLNYKTHLVSFKPILIVKQIHVKIAIFNKNVKIKIKSRRTILGRLSNIKKRTIKIALSVNDTDNSEHTNPQNDSLLQNLLYYAIIN